MTALRFIKSIDRLSRNDQETLEQWQLLTQKRGVDICVPNMPLLFTTLSKDLLSTFIADLVPQLLSFVAQNEHETIRMRQAEGIAAAKQRGVHFGNPGKINPNAIELIYAQWLFGAMTTSETIYALPVSHSTFYRFTRKAKYPYPPCRSPPKKIHKIFISAIKRSLFSKKNICYNGLYQYETIGR